MEKLSTMKDLTDEFKLSVRSAPEVFQALASIVTRLAVTRRVRFRGKKPTRAAVVNAALLYLDSLPPADWERALAAGMARLERFLESDDIPAETSAHAETGPPAAPQRVEMEVEDVSPPPAKPGRRSKKN